MRIKHSGKIVDDFYTVGPPGMPVYVLDGPRPALFDAGYTTLSLIYETEIKAILGDREPAYLFITHSHFDHVGSAARFKEIWPDLMIAGSAACRDILARPGAVKLIRELNAGGISAARRLGIDPVYEGPFETVEIEMVVEPDQHYELGAGLTVQSLHTPGHTRDFMSYWIPEREILIGSEAVGCDVGAGYIQAEFLIDYERYLESMKRLARLSPRVLCPGHRIVLTDADARRHLAASLEATLSYVDLVKRLILQENGDLDAVAARVKAVEWDPLPFPKQPEPAYLLNTRQRVKTVRDAMCNEK